MVEESESALESSNGLAWNSLTRNSLTRNSLTRNSLTRNGLATSALWADPNVQSDLSNADTRDLVKYIVSCALPAGQSVSFAALPIPKSLIKFKFTFPGEIGMAPEWATGACDENCQRWISACVLARVNAYGVSVQINLYGNNAAISGLILLKPKGIGPLETLYSEGIFYGNIFRIYPVLASCQSPNAVEMLLMLFTYTNLKRSSNLFFMSLRARTSSTESASPSTVTISLPPLMQAESPFLSDSEPSSSGSRGAPTSSGKSAV